MTVIYLVFVISPKSNFCVLLKTYHKQAWKSIESRAVGSLRKLMNVLITAFSIKVSFHLGPQVLSLLSGMVGSQSSLESLIAEQNRCCAILQRSSKKQKIHRFSSVWRGDFWLCDLDSLGITAGDVCCKQERGYVARGIMQFFIFHLLFSVTDAVIP